jgi:uncharacterized cofD-like protein
VYKRQLKGHSFGNLFLSALEKVTGSFDRAVLEAGRILSARGSVIPVTTDKVQLVAEAINGTEVRGQHTIDEFVWSGQSDIKKLWLEPQCSIHPLAKLAIAQSDLIVIAPGSVFTSLIPNLLVEGVKETIAKSKAPVVYIANLMTERGHTGAYFMQDFVELIEDYLGKGRIDYVVYNNRIPDGALLERYKKEMERQPVRLDPKRRKRTYKVVGANLLARRPASQNPADPLPRTLIRHDPGKLSEILEAMSVLKNTRKYFK